MNQLKHADPDHPIHELLAQRWSPYAFADQGVTDHDLRSLFEAARWTASSYNEQPWRYIVAKREDAENFKRVHACLLEGNQPWAKAASVLAIGCVSLRFALNDKPNAAAVHDLGAASASLTFEATARGLVVHQMIGIDPDKVRQTFAVPDDYQPFTGIAIGYAAPAETLPEQLRERDLAPRTRKPLSEFVFSGQWGTSAKFL